MCDVYIYICTHRDRRIIFIHKKGGSTCICNMDEPGGHYSKWNKLEKYHYQVIYVGNLKKSQSCRHGE